MPQAHVIGLGKSGAAAARLLRQRGWAVVLSDRNPTPPTADLVGSLTAAGVDLQLGHSFTGRRGRIWWCSAPASPGTCPPWWRPEPLAKP
ncbi:MAG: hypothetical protein LVS60_12545 [Nodosilinea sp. LVE1205-7]|jgi:UDP-N-acetylmuramoylalanine-D-glutamate ligase